uniref:BRCT domain-containing protein n=1 Tax=Meloidogyne hapla TaxID=6305 RepID=A0A1I8BWG0_MELHA
MTTILNFESELIYQFELKAELKMNESFKTKSFSSVTISFTGISKDDQAQLTKLVHEMGGNCKQDVDENVTHLVATNCDNKSENYIAAKRLKIPVLLPCWIQDAYSSTNSMVDFLNEDSLENYRTPIFYDCEITISGFNNNDRIEIGRMVEMNGGTFVGQMVKSTCTHLITTNNSGEKYHRAKEWKNVYIVNVKWLRESVEYKVRLDELEFAVEPICEVKKASSIEMVPMSSAEEVCINEVMSHAEEVCQCEYKVRLDELEFAVETIHEVKKASPIEMVPMSSAEEVCINNEVMSRAEETCHIESKMENEKNESFKSKPFNEVTIAFTGISFDKREELAKLVHEMGGHCTGLFDENVTHLIAEICDNKSEKYIEITISGFTSTERIEIGRLIDLHGGKFTGHMNRASCTHLITYNNSGEKYRCAKEWKNIYIVNVNWLRKSIGYVRFIFKSLKCLALQKVRLNESRFAIGGDE